MLTLALSMLNENVNMASVSSDLPDHCLAAQAFAGLNLGELPGKPKE